MEWLFEMDIQVPRDRGTKMIQLKATCLRCEGTGYVLPNASSEHSHCIHCPNCEGKGTLILTSQNWDISLKRVPPFSLEEEAIGVV
jgi:DnaJ-class molecular chaperone